MSGFRTGDIMSCCSLKWAVVPHHHPAGVGQKWSAFIWGSCVFWEIFLLNDSWTLCVGQG